MADNLLSTSEVFYGGGKSSSPPAAPGAGSPGAPEKSDAEVMYGNPGGSPAETGNIEAALSGFSDRAAMAARMARDYDGAKAVEAATAALVGNLGELQFSRNAAVELAGLMSEYEDRKNVSDGDRQAAMDSALETLSGEWGPRFPAMFEGAKAVIKAMSKGHPGILTFFHDSGLSRDVRFLRMAGEVAKARGLVRG